MISSWLQKNIAALKRLAHIFHISTNLNCQVIDDMGRYVYQAGVEVPFCDYFKLLTEEMCPCETAHLNACKQSEKLGESYVFFCPGGLGKFAMAIATQGIFRGGIIAGPLQMNVPDIYLVDRLIKSYGIPMNSKGVLQANFKMVPLVDHYRVHCLAELLQIMVKDLIDEEKYEIKKKTEFYIEQRIIGENIQEIKEKNQTTYPIELEKELSDKIRHGDCKGAKSVLNELLGFILFQFIGNRTAVITMLLELLVVMSRAAVEGGAKYEEIVLFNTKFYEDVYKSTNIEEICLWMVQALERLTEMVFTFDDSQVENRNLIRKALLYIRENYNKEITLEDVANHVKLSLTYFCRLFRKETKRNFSDYINWVRVEESKKLLMDVSYSLTEVALLSGFSDQSYFSKVFKRYENQTPGQFRKFYQG